MTERFLVTGGAGYVGSHMVDLLARQDAAITVVDDLRQGHRAALSSNVELVVANIDDTAMIDAVLAGRSWHAIIHFAALSLRWPRDFGQGDKLFPLEQETGRYG